MRRHFDGALKGRRAPEWLGRPERGSVRAIRFTAWVALSLGRPLARLLLYPICLYFLLFSGAARAASRKYLGKVLGRAPGLGDLFRHYHTFAAAILDRVYLLNEQYGLFDVRAYGADIVDGVLARGDGCLLLGAHIGSFEIIRSLAREAGGLRVSLVMYEENARKLNSVLAAINPNLSEQVIPLGMVDSMLKVEEALQSGACVGMLADRTIESDGTLACRFLGEPARFALGPLRLAAVLKRPVVLMFGLYRGGNRYEVHFEQLADFSATDRKDRSATIERALRQYAERMEHYCRAAPYNWFNFYDFWK
jgi:predicted LPLAT superfamily acyltransferase